MNCRIGDIAVVIHAVHQENLGVWVSVEKPGREPGEWVVRLLCVARGRVVRVVEEDREPLLQMVKQTLWWSCEALQHIRRFKGFGNTEQPPFPPGSMVPVPDSALMPLHDGDGQDESLTWKDRPTSGDPVHQLIEEHAES